MSEVLLIIAVIAVALVWQNTMRCREAALFGARRRCEAIGLQLLDQSVQQARLSLSRDANDRWRVWREYRFDYSIDGADRWKGRLVMLGHQVQHIDLESTHPDARDILH